MLLLKTGKMFKSVTAYVYLHKKRAHFNEVSFNSKQNHGCYLILSIKLLRKSNSSRSCLWNKL